MRISVLPPNVITTLQSIVKKECNHYTWAPFHGIVRISAVSHQCAGGETWNSDVLVFERLVVAQFSNNSRDTERREDRGSVGDTVWVVHLVFGTKGRVHVFEFDAWAQCVSLVLDIVYNENEAMPLFFHLVCMLCLHTVLQLKTDSFLVWPFDFP